MEEHMFLIIWAIWGAYVEVSGAPAVSLSFGGTYKNDSGVEFAYKNGTWVSAENKIHSVKSISPAKKGERVNYTRELEDLFRRINSTLTRKIAPVGEAKPVKGTSEKPLGELFLEWLGKHEQTLKPVAAFESTPIPVVGLKIDFDEGSSAASRDFRVTSNPKISLVDKPARKTLKSDDNRNSGVSNQNSPINRPINFYFEPGIPQANQIGLYSDNLKTHVRKRRGKSDKSVKFIMEPLTLTPLVLVNSKSAGLSNTYEPQSLLTKRDAKFVGDLKSKIRKAPSQQSFRHVRHPRSFIDLFTLAPANHRSSQPPLKYPQFDEALPVESHVKKRHDKLFLNSKPNNVDANIQIPTADESDSGQLLVRNEIPNDRKNKLNDLPKYVMKFLSECKALIEQNYDESNAKNNYEDEAARPSQNDSPNDNSRVMSKSAPDSTNVATTIAEIDEFESISINKKPLKDKGENDSVKLSMDRADSESDGWELTSSSTIINSDRAKMEPKSLLSAYDSDDLYDDVMGFHVGDSIRQSGENVIRKTYYTSEANASTCRQLMDNFAPSTDAPNCRQEPEVTTLSSGQWKLLMDLLNERLPRPTTKCPTTCPGMKKTTCKVKPAGTSPVTCAISRMTSRQKSDMGKTASKSSKHSAPMLNNSTGTTCPTTCSTTCSTPTCSITTTCSTPTRTITTTCSTPTRSIPTTCATTKCSTSTCHTSTTCATTTTTTEESTPCDSLEAETEDCTETPVPKNVEEKNKPALPRRYPIQIDISKPKQELPHLHGRTKSNWFDNIKNLKLLEGLRSNQIPLKPNYNVVNPKSAALGTQSDPGSAERMIAEGVIPLKTGSSLNLYISYVLNKTKAHKGRAPAGSNILDDNWTGASVPRKPFESSKVLR